MPASEDCFGYVYGVLPGGFFRVFVGSQVVFVGL